MSAPGPRLLWDADGAAQAPESLAPTYGWDTVSAIPVPLVNAAIVAGGSSPAGFASSEGSGDGAENVSATFGPWQITPGGDGRNLRMAVPMPTLAVGTATYRDVAATIEITLTDLPHTDAPPPPRGVSRKLVARTTTEDPQDDPVAVVVDIESPEPLGVITTAVVRAAFETWVNSHLDEFTHIFAVVDIDEEIDAAEQWSFVTPSYLDYAYLDGGTPAESTFAVLCTTAGRSGDTLTSQVSPNAIPEGAHGGFLVSAERYLHDLLVPALEHCYAGLESGDVVVASDASSVHLAPGVSVAITPVEHDGSTYHPRLARLDITVLGDTVEIVSQTRTEVSPGITAITDATRWYHITLADRRDGTQTLRYVEAQPSSVVHSTETSPGVKIAEIIATVIAAIAIVIAGVLTDGAAFVVAAVVIGALGGIAAATPEIIATANTDASPSIDALVTNSVSPITWPDVAFHLTSAGLDESLRLGGTLR